MTYPPLKAPIFLGLAARGATTADAAVAAAAAGVAVEAYLREIIVNLNVCINRMILCQ